eukprot:jgi/Mesvir1/13857/Mv16000-RA.1
MARHPQSQRDVRVGKKCSTGARELNALKGQVDSLKQELAAEQGAHHATLQALEQAREELRSAKLNLSKRDLRKYSGTALEHMHALKKIEMRRGCNKKLEGAVGRVAQVLRKELVRSALNTMPGLKRSPSKQEKRLAKKAKQGQENQSPSP